MKIDQNQRMRLTLDTSHVMHGETIIGNAIVRYGDFKNGHIRLKI